MSENKKAHKNLIVWKQGYEFVKETYRLTEKFPKHELYGLVSQLRRAAVSILANIVEGQAKNSKKDFLRFLNISKGSIRECDFFLELSQDLGYIKHKEYDHVEKLRRKTAYLLHRLTEGIIKTTALNNL